MMLVPAVTQAFLSRLALGTTVALRLSTSFVQLKQSPVASFVVLVLVTGIIYAATLEGTIKKVDGDKNSLVITGKDKKDVTVTVDKNTKITLDSKKAKVADLNPGAKVTLDGKYTILANLKPGQKIRINHAANRASMVEATSAKCKS